MDIQINTNKLINDIMSNANSAIMIFAPIGTGKSAFISELGSRYEKVFWFCAKVDDMEAFSLCLAEKMLVDNPELLLKVKQLSYCDSDYNNDKIIINAILEYVSSLKGNFLLVMEHMDAIPKDFDLKLIERLIKHCPKNLKIVISAQKFINFEYTKFDPLYPILIDENVMGKRAKSHDFNNYIKDLNEEEKAFLYYISELNCIDTEYTSLFYKNGEAVLNMLSRKSWYVSSRHDGKYCLNSLFKDFLEVEKNVNNMFYRNFARLDAKTGYADYLFGKEKYYSAFKLYTETENIDKIEACIKNGLKDKTFLLKLQSYAKFKKNLLYVDNKNYPYYQIYLALISYYFNNFAQAFDNIEKLVLSFKNNDNEAMFLCYYIMVKSLVAQNDYQRAHDLISEVREKFIDYDLVLQEEILCMIPQVYKEIDLPVNFNIIKKIEEEILIPENSKKIWYAKGLQAVAEAYFDAGSYRKAMIVTNKIREIIDFYVIPHNIIMFYYYSGNIESANKLALEALEFSEKHEITKDVSLLYTALANFDLYYGNIKEALSKFDSAVKLDKENSYTKFFNIALRAMAYARYSDVNYAKEITQIYLKYCETYQPQFANMLMCAMAFCYAKLKSPEQAYFYATKCIKTSTTRSVFWLIGMAIATTHLLNSGELKDAQKLVKNIIKSSYVYGMDTMIVDNIDIFEPLFDYASENGIETEYLDSIYIAVNQKKSQKQKVGNFEIRLFGNTSALYKDLEVQWKTRKAKELFFHYVLAGDKGIDRNVIINYLWKDYLYESAINNLKTTNNIIRKTLNKYNVDFKLEYMNSKYILTMKEVKVDFKEYIKLSLRYKKEANTNRKIEIMNQMLDIYKYDFSLDMNKPDFNNARQTIKQELMIKLLKLSRELSAEGDYIEAKNFIQALAAIDRNTDYSQKIAEIDTYITIQG